MNKETDLTWQILCAMWACFALALVLRPYSQIAYGIFMVLWAVCVVAWLVDFIMRLRRNKTKTVIKTNIPDISNNDRKQSKKIAKKLYQLLEITQKMDYPVKSIRAKEDNLTVEAYITDSNEEKRPD